MDIKNISIDDIFPYEKNPRKNEDAVKYVAESIKLYGFRSPIVVDKNMVIICGHTRHKAARQLGLEVVPVVIAEDLTDEQVKAYRIADNKTSDMSLWDNKLLLQELEELEDMFTGFDFAELEEMKELDEKQNDVLQEDYDMVYEIKFSSADKEKIEKIKKYWDGIDGEQQSTGS